MSTAVLPTTLDRHQAAAVAAVADAAVVAPAAAAASAAAEAAVVPCALHISASLAWSPSCSMAQHTLVPCLLHRPSCVYTQCTFVLPNPPLAQLHTMYILAQGHLVVLLFEPDSVGEHLQLDSLPAALVHCVVNHRHPALRRPLLAAQYVCAFTR